MVKKLPAKKSRVFFANPDEEQNSLKDFYNDLDKRAKKKGCSFSALIVFMIILFFTIIVGIFYIKNNFRIGVKYINENEVANNNQGILGKVEDELINKADGQEVAILFAEEELAYYLGVDEADFPLKKASLRIEKTGIILSGRTRDSYLSIPIKVNFKPVIKDGKVVIEIDQMQGGFVTLPKVIKDGLNSSLDDVINKKMSAVNNFDFKAVILNDRVLKLIGVKKSI